MRTILFSLASLLFALSLPAQNVCTRTFDEHARLIDIRANHRYQMAGQDVPIANLLSIIGRANFREGATFLYIVVEPEATYGEAQALADRMLGSIPRLQVAFLQPPQDKSDMFRCVPAALAQPTNTILQRIPLPATPISPHK